MKETLLVTRKKERSRKKTGGSDRTSGFPFQLIYEHSPIGIALVESESGKIVEVNHRFAEIIRRPFEELPSSDWMGYMHPDDVNEYRDSITEMNCGNTSGFKMDRRYLQLDGSVVWVRMTVTAVLEPENKRLSHLCMVEDISEQKRLESLAALASNRYRRLFDASQDGILLLDDETGIVEDVNPFLVSLFGIGKDYYIGKHFYDLAIIRDFPEIRNIRTILRENSQFHVDDLHWKTSAGRRLDFSFDASGHLVDGAATVQCIFRDVTSQMEAKRALLYEKRLAETTLNSIGDGVFTTDSTGRIATLNKAAELLTGWSLKEALGLQSSVVFSIFLRATGQRQSDIVKEVLDSGTLKLLDEPTYLLTKDGVERPIEDSAAPIIHEDGQNVGVVVIFRDTTGKESRLGRIEYLSYHDQLTGLFNRRFYEEELKRLDTRRNMPFTIAMGDINGLKLINDSFGHTMGDELLKKAADVIRSVCRADDIVARLGGDEFILLLPRTDAVQAEELSKRIAECAARETIETIPLSISIGHATKTNKETAIDAVTKLAEENMYRNKLVESSSMRNQTINLILNTLFEKSHREMLHSQRVSHICEAIAEQLKLDRTAINQLRTAGLMHDIGKVGIDESILDGTSSLTGNEWTEIHRHPEIGYRILNSVNEFSDIARFVLEHQERWDGLGYPMGLKGELISLPARVIAVADAYDAMTSTRTYRKVMGRTAAIHEIKRCSNTQFDPTVVDAFIQIKSL